MNIWKRRIIHNEIRYDILSHKFVSKEYNLYTFSMERGFELLMAVLYIFLLFTVIAIGVRITLEASISINSILIILLEVL